MKNFLCIAGLSLALGGMSPAQSEAMYEEEPGSPSEEENQHFRVLSEELLKTSSEMWFLLSSISSRSDADSASARFLELLTRTFELDNQLSNAPIIPSIEAECAGMMDGMQLRILEILDETHSEFVSLCRANCYGSNRLKKAFLKAVSLGMFAEENLEFLQDPGSPLNDTETAQELARMQRLAEPDRAVLNVLISVKNERSADNAVPELCRLCQHFEALLPDEQIGRRAFSPQAQVQVNTVIEPIEPILWGIRSEIVRIAGLPGYEAENYDRFSEALDTIFENMGATHRMLFNSVFDASFRADLDSAMHENAFSSQ